jgi:hypothetical protein
MLEDKLHLGKTKKNEFSFGISLDLHYLCTQNLIGYVETAESFVAHQNTTITRRRSKAASSCFAEAWALAGCRLEEWYSRCA